MKLEQLRKKIDVVDRQILKLLNTRAKLVLQIGKYKKLSGSKEIFIPHREKTVLRNILKLNPGPLSKELTESIFREIISACRTIQKRLKIVYFGDKHSDTHSAGLKLFGEFTDYIPVHSLSEVFRHVEQGKADYGVVTSEKTAGESNISAYNLFINSNLKICAEIKYTKGRFLVIGKNIADITGHDKTSLIFSLKDKAGTLDDILLVLKHNKVSLTKIESEPSDKSGEYIFFIDFIGHVTDKSVQKIITQIEKHSSFVKVAGSYPVEE